MRPSYKEQDRTWESRSTVPQNLRDLTQIYNFRHIKAGSSQFCGKEMDGRPTKKYCTSPKFYTIMNIIMLWYSNSFNLDLGLTFHRFQLAINALNHTQYKVQVKIQQKIKLCNITNKCTGWYVCRGSTILCLFQMYFPLFPAHNYITAFQNNGK